MRSGASRRQVTRMTFALTIPRRLLATLATVLAAATLLAAVPASAAPAPAAARKSAKPDPLAPGLTGTERLAALVERVKLEQQGAQDHGGALRPTPGELPAGRRRGVAAVSSPTPRRTGCAGSTPSPNPISVVIRGEEMTTWYRDLKRADETQGGPLLEPGVQVPRRERQPADPARVLHGEPHQPRRRRATPTGWSWSPSTSASPSASRR